MNQDEKGLDGTKRQFEVLQRTKKMLSSRSDHPSVGDFLVPDLIVMYQNQILEIAHLMIFVTAFRRA